MIYTNNWNTLAYGKISPASNYHFGLYLGATYTAAQSSTFPALVITPAANAFPGQISSATLTVPSHPAGGTDFFVIKGWDVDAPSYEAAISGGQARYAGVSGVGQITTGLGGGGTSPVFFFSQVLVG